MTVGGFIRITIFLLAPALAACAPIETKTMLLTPADGQVRSAGPGDTVIAFQMQRSLPNAFGHADIFGRTTNAGRTIVRYMGTQDSQAIFERSGIAVASDATTMNSSPFVIPQTSSTTMTGSVGTTPISGSSTTTSYQVVPPQGASEYAMAERPIQIRISDGQSVTMEGRTLRVIRVSPTSVDYVVQ